MKKISIILIMIMMLEYIIVPVHAIEINDSEEKIIDNGQIVENSDEEKVESDDQISNDEEQIEKTKKVEEVEKSKDTNYSIKSAPQPNYNVTPQIQYQSHVSKIGWQAFKKNGEMSGTTGQNKAIEAIKISTEGVYYSSYVQEIGWQNEVKTGQISGTTGKNKRIEAIKIHLDQQLENNYDIYYRVHVSCVGWLDWAKNNEMAGSIGYSRAIEAIEIKILPKGSIAPGKTEKPYIEEKLQVEYQSHISTIGWQEVKKNGQISGTTGKSKAIEAIKLNLNKLEGNIYYSSYVQEIGWQNEVKTGQISGTTGKNKRIEAIKIHLDQQLENNYDIYYRVHVSCVGWLDWAKNNEMAGSIGYSRAIEAIEIKILPKGSAAPGSTSKTYMEKEVQAEYQSHVSKIGWQGVKKDGEMSGTTKQSKKIEAIKINLTNRNISGNIEYEVHVQNIGWQGIRTTGQMAGTTGQNKQVEAIRIRLTGELEQRYDIYYRAYIQNYGWLGWTSNWNNAGSSNCSLRMEAIQIKILPKGSPAPGSTTNSYVTSYWKTINGKTYFYKEGKIVTGWQTISGVKYYFNSSGVMLGKNVKKIMDISYAQYKNKPTIDWNKVKNTDIDGAIVRLGYGSADSQEDTSLVTSINGLNSIGRPYGVYLFSYAENANDARLEAEFTKRLIKKHSLNPTLGIYLDIETWPGLETISNRISAAAYDSIITTYINTLKNDPALKGYNIGVYTNKNYALNRLNANSRKYVKWIAQYNSTCTYTGSYNMWQYTSSGSVSGITGNVDLNIKFN